MLPWFDGHCDTVSALMKSDGSLAANDLHVDLSRLEAYAPRAQVFALFGDVGAAMRRSCRTEEEFIRRVRDGEVREDESGARLYEELLEKFSKETEACSGRVLFCRSAEDADRAAREGKLAAWLAVEGGELLHGRTPEDAYRDGVRIVTLTWNYPNSLGGSCISGGGLTEKGRAFVRRCGELGIVIDVSHGSDALFYDVAETSEKPFIASHSNARAVFRHRRNLTDDQFRILAAKGGTAGINLFADFLAAGRCTLSDVLRHVEHFLSLGGEKHVSLGCDLDGCDRLPEGVSGVQDVRKIADEMARLGYSDALIHDIFYRNLDRVLREVTG